MITEKVALVTGASRGIGAVIARRLAGDGFAVAVNFASSAKDAEDVVHRIEQDGGQAVAIKADVSQPSAVAQMVAATLERFGRLDVLVHNAGIQLLGTLEEMDDDAFDHLIAVNLTSTFTVLREGVSAIADGGRIVVLSSGTTNVLAPRYGVYAATKAGVEALAGVLAKEMRGRGVTVNAIAPGPVATDLYLTGKSEATINEAAARSPLERLGQSDDIASVVSQLTGEAGGWINGQTILVNGGFS